MTGKALGKKTLIRTCNDAAAIIEVASSFEKMVPTQWYMIDWSLYNSSSIQKTWTNGKKCERNGGKVAEPRDCRACDVKQSAFTLIDPNEKINVVVFWTVVSINKILYGSVADGNVAPNAKNLLYFFPSRLFPFHDQSSLVSPLLKLQSPRD